jgi:hypothetical protein
MERTQEIYRCAKCGNVTPFNRLVDYNVDQAMICKPCFAKYGMDDILTGLSDLMGKAKIIRKYCK